MSGSHRIGRVVRTRESSSNFSNPPGANYEYASAIDSKDNLIYIREPTPIPHRFKRQTLPCPPNQRRTRGKSCVKRICSGLVNFFRFRTTNVGYKEELRYPSPALCYREGHLPLESSSTHFDPNNNPVACTSLTNFTGWRNEEAAFREGGDENGEYIIYIPRLSRTKLQEKFVDPLRRASYDPVIIHPICRHCVGCHSCNLVNSCKPYNIMHNIFI